MQITALIQVIHYLKEKSEDPALLEGYKKLADVLGEASGKPEEDFSTTIGKEKDLLQKLLWESDPSEWGYASYCLFEKINKNHLFGKPAADWLGQNIKPATKDYRKAETEINKKIKLISKLSDSLGKFTQLFDQVIPADIFTTEEENTNNSNVILYFEGGLKVKNIDDLERYSRLWDNILASFSKLAAEESLTLNIINVEKGNIVLGAAAPAKTMNAIMAGITGTLSSFPLLLRVRKIQNEMTHIPLNNNLIDVLEGETEVLINQTAFNVAQKLTFEYLNENIDTEEMIRILSRSLKQIQSFIEKGGRIEVKSSNAAAAAGEVNKTLNESFATAIEIESLLKSLAEELAKKETVEVESE